MDWKDVGGLRRGHSLIFLLIYSFYGYQVCPYLESLSIWWLSAPAAAILALQHAGVWAMTRWSAEAPLNLAVRNLFWLDFTAFAAGGVALAAFNLVAFGFPLDSGAKVALGFIALGFYVSLDLAFTREIKLAQQLREEQRSFPLNASFLAFQKKFVLFSMINIVVISLVVTMVVLKDLIWAAQTDIDPIRAQMLIMAELTFILVVLGAYLYRVISQYGRKTNIVLQEERDALTRAKAGDFSGRVTVSSSDEFGEIAHLTNEMIVRLCDAITEIERTRDVTIKALVSLSAKRDNETGLHLLRTQLYVVELALELAKSPAYADLIDDEFIAQLFASAPLHDIGKVGVPDAVLTKPGRLTDDEFEVMKTHAEIGALALAEADDRHGASSFLRMAQDIARSHHEKWDGSGYPDKLVGEQIPLPARLMAIADVYDALRSKRVYKPAFSHEEAVRIITEGRGAHFDPTLVDAFLRIEAQFETIAHENAEHDAPQEYEKREQTLIAS